MVWRRLGFAVAVCALALTLASCGTGYGFHPGTDAFASCLQKESLARRYWAAPPTPYWGWSSWGWSGPWGPYWP